MQFRSENIRDALYSYLEPSLKQIDPEFQRLVAIPTRQSQLPGIVVEIEKTTPGSAGIGNFLGYQVDADGKATGEIYGRQYKVRVNTDIWLDYQDKTEGLEIMQAVTDQLNDLLALGGDSLREHGIFDIRLRKSGEIESNDQNKLLPQNMQKTIRRVFKLSLICEVSEIKAFENIDKITITSKLTEDKNSETQKTFIITSISA